MELTLSHNLIHSTVRIECADIAGRLSSGTGFFFNFDIDQEKIIPTIITNRHVFEGAAIMSFHFSLTQEDGRLIISRKERIIISGFENAWIPHPDPDVDLAALPIQFILNKLEQRGIFPFFRWFNPQTLPDVNLLNSISTIEDITMIGYPNGIWDHVNNFPIARRGITATPYKFDYIGKREFVIDAACFPGSSGSPVILLNQGSYITKNGDLAVGNRFALLGVLYGGPQHTAEGEIVVANIPTNMRPVPISRIPNNLGFCIKSSRIMEFHVMLRAMGRTPPSVQIKSEPI